MLCTRVLSRTSLSDQKCKVEEERAGKKAEGGHRKRGQKATSVASAVDSGDDDSGGGSELSSAFCLFQSLVLLCARSNLLLKQAIIMATIASDRE